MLQHTDTYEGFEVVGSWTPPGPDYTNSAVAPIVTTAQVLFPTSVLNFNGFIQPQKSGADGTLYSASTRSALDNFCLPSLLTLARSV